MKKSLGAKALAYPAPVWVVGTYDKDGRPNAMTAAWGGICCSRPPSMAISLRKATYTHGNIVLRKAFTISIPGENFAKIADYFGISSGADMDKFAQSGLTPTRSELVDAPYVAECPMVIELKLTHTIEIGWHTQFIGEIVDVKADESFLNGDGMPDIEKLRPLIYCPGTMTYHGVGHTVGKAFSIGKELLSDLA